MNQNALWKISVKTVPEGEEAVTEMLGRIFEIPASSYTDIKTTETTVSVYLDEKPNLAARAQVGVALERIKSFGLNIAPARLRLTRVLRQDWAESWKRYFRPLEIGSALLIKPSWSKRRPRKGQAIIILDPGLSFGTGQHPTTSFCLEQLAAHRNDGAAQSVLDLGTGSGILAIAAAKLGYQPVHAIDLDAEAIRIARANARRNRSSRRIRFLEQDLTKVPRQASENYSVICANLIS